MNTILEKIESIKVNPKVAARLMAQVRENLGPQLDDLEERAYARGYDDHAAGRTRAVAFRRYSQASVAAGDLDATERATENAPRPSEQELANRARKYQDDQAKLGKTVSNLEAVTKVYNDAGIPLR